MSTIMGLLSPLGLGGGAGGRRRSDDDFVDRMNHSHTVIILIVFAIIVSTKQYVGDPIQCWVPAYFTTPYADYTNKVCWVSNTYNNPLDGSVPGESNQTPKKHIVYYQWIPMILLTQAFFFFLPNTVWSLLNTRSGMDLNSMVEAARGMHQGDSHEKSLRFVVKQLDRFCGSFRPRRRGRCMAMRRFFAERCMFACGMKHGTYLLAIYMLSKLLYVINAIAQFFLLDMFMGNGYRMYGVYVLKSLLEGNEWVGAQHFPRVTLCDFTVRQLGNVHNYTVQCVLPINLFNEKIFVFVWFWFVLIASLSVCNLAIWLGRTLFRVDHVAFVKRYLTLLNKTEGTADKKTLRRFVFDYLRPDGVLTLRLICLNTNELVIAEIIGELWEYYRENPPSLKRDDSNEMEAEDV